MRKNTLIVVALSAMAVGAIIWLVAGNRDGASSLSITFSRYAYNDDSYWCGVVTVSNAGTRTAAYRGDGGGTPYCTMLVSSPTGWVNPRPFICGFGSRTCMLGPGDHRRVYVPVTSFPIALRTNETWMVGLSFSDATFHDRLPERASGWFGPKRGPWVEAWSQPVKYEYQPIGIP